MLKLIERKADRQLVRFRFSVCIYIYGNYFLDSQRVVTLRCISLDLGRIWPDEVYADGVYYPTRPSRVLYMTSMYVYLEYMVILILYATIIVLYNILKNMCSFEFFSRSKDLEYLNISMSTYSN
jgi:hypothetical protein